MKRKIVLQVRRDQVDKFFEPDVMKSLQELGEVVYNPFDRAYTPEELKERLADAAVCISTWGSPKISKEMLQSAGNLELHVHMAGSVKPVIAEEAFDSGVTVLSGAHAIAESVAECVLALILTSGHQVFRVERLMRGGGWKSPDAGVETDELRGKTVGLVALGMTAREVIRLLKPFQVRLIGYDPYVSEERAKELGVELMPLEEVIQRSQILSVHAPAIPETEKMLGQEQLRLIPDGSLLVNTSRGAVFDQAALIEELKRNRFSAALDVFEKEPLPADSELRNLPNVILRPHLAGVNPSSRRRIGRSLVEDMHRYFSGEPVKHAVQKWQLALMT